MKFAFLKLFPAYTSDGFKRSGNLTLRECEAPTKDEAVNTFRQTSPVALDNDGYGKQGDFSYCVAERFGS